MSPAGQPLPIPDGLPLGRKCDCGCLRPVAYHVPALDLGFSHRCVEAYLAASAYALSLEAEAEALAVEAAALVLAVPAPPEATPSFHEPVAPTPWRRGRDAH